MYSKYILLKSNLRQNFIQYNEYFNKLIPNSI
jgi:hypothetical protein